MPILFSFFSTATPGDFRSTMKALMPLCFSARSQEAKTTPVPRYPPLVMKILLPLMTNSSPARLYIVAIPPASLPALGSVNRRQPMISPVVSAGSHFFFCSSLPKA